MKNPFTHSGQKHIVVKAVFILLSWLDWKLSKSPLYQSASCFWP